MQMLCKVSNAFSDVKCPVCGQGFMVYWTRLQAKHRGEQRERMLSGLRLQHTDDLTDDAHASAFHLPDGLAPAVLGESSAVAMPALLGMYS